MIIMNILINHSFTVCVSHSLQVPLWVASKCSAWMCLPKLLLSPSCTLSAHTIGTIFLNVVDNPAHSQSCKKLLHLHKDKAAVALPFMILWPMNMEGVTSRQKSASILPLRQISKMSLQSLILPCQHSWTPLPMRR